MIQLDYNIREAIRMRFIKKLLLNLVLLAGMGILLFNLYPDTMKHVVSLYGQLLGPLAVVMLVVRALPDQRTKSE